jgi:hypothetical protein
MPDMIWETRPQVAGIVAHSSAWPAAALIERVVQPVLERVPQRR